MTTWEVECGYYQYNSGAADNGDYVKRVEFADEAAAVALAVAVKAAAAGGTVEYGDMDADALTDHLIPWSGYLKDARVFRVEREEVPVPSPAVETRP